jgi:opacity protein-like surface antigen
MKKLLLAAAILAALTGCYKDPQSTKIEGNGVKVDLLFDHNGIKMYRFVDGGYVHYFTDRGETSTTQQSGKTYYEETIK